MSKSANQTGNQTLVCNWEIDHRDELTRQRELLTMANQQVPNPGSVALEPFIDGMLEAGASDREWRVGLGMLLNQSIVSLNDDFIIVRQPTVSQR